MLEHSGADGPEVWNCGLKQTIPIWLAGLTKFNYFLSSARHYIKNEAKDT